MQVREIIDGPLFIFYLSLNTESSDTLQNDSKTNVAKSKDGSASKSVLNVLYYIKSLDAL